MQFIPILKDIELNGFGFLILFNFAFLIPCALFVLVKLNMLQSKNEVKTNVINNYNKIYSYITKVAIFVVILFGINLFFYNLHNLYYEPFNTKEFWEKTSKNSLSQSRLSLLLNPIKVVSKDTLIMDIHNIKNKIIEKFPSDKINIKTFTQKPNYFYIPYNDYRIVFILDIKNNLMLTVFGKFEDDKQVKILDVGYIQMKKK